MCSCKQYILHVFSPFSAPFKQFTIVFSCSFIVSFIRRLVFRFTSANKSGSVYLFIPNPSKKSILRQNIYIIRFFRALGFPFETHPHREKIHLILTRFFFCFSLFFRHSFFRLSSRAFVSVLAAGYVWLIKFNVPFAYDDGVCVRARTVCNRTWFGDIGKTYEMEIDKPSALPFVCHLNFTAPGGLHGDIIQVSTIFLDDKVIQTVMQTSM